jgi:hypothetical protein
MNRLAVSDAARELGVTRLCHFAPFKNVHHILASGAILSSARVKQEYPERYNPTDELRLDKLETHVCATVEYPNVWYLEKVEANNDVWIDSIVFLIAPDVLDHTGAAFCVRNAASRAPVTEGRAGFDAMYAQQVQGKGLWTRERGHPRWLPTDLQAEVLIPGAVPLSAVLGAVVKDVSAARRFMTQVRLSRQSLGMPRIVSEGFFDREVLRRLRTGGRRPLEERFEE